MVAAPLAVGVAAPGEGWARWRNEKREATAAGLPLPQVAALSGWELSAAAWGSAPKVRRGGTSRPSSSEATEVLLARAVAPAAAALVAGGCSGGRPRSAVGGRCGCVCEGAAVAAGCCCCCCC